MVTVSNNSCLHVPAGTKGPLGSAEDQAGPFATTAMGIDKKIFKRIFEDHWAPFTVTYPQFDTPWHNYTVQQMLNCGDPERMGFTQYRCPSCGETRRIAFTCKSAFCLSCAKPYTDRWAEFIDRRLLPGVDYMHAVFTVPKFLHKWFYTNPALLKHLMRAAYSCLKDLFRAVSSGGLDIGAIMVLQTAGRSGNFNPHVHVLVTRGGLSRRGRWVTPPFPSYDLFHHSWQDHLLMILQAYVSDPAIHKDLATARSKYPRGFVAYRAGSKVPVGRRRLASYCAKYLVSPPISIRRIESYDGHAVTYWYHDHRSGQIKHETISALRFIGRMIQHVLPKGFQRVGYYGIHANVRYRRMRAKVARILRGSTAADPRGFGAMPRPHFAALFFKSFSFNPHHCPKCGDLMEVERVWHPTLGTIRDNWSDMFVAEEAIEPLNSS